MLASPDVCGLPASVLAVVEREADAWYPWVNLAARWTPAAVGPVSVTETTEHPAARLSGLCPLSSCLSLLDPRKQTKLRVALRVRS